MKMPSSLLKPFSQFLLVIYSCSAVVDNLLSRSFSCLEKLGKFLGIQEDCIKRRKPYTYAHVVYYTEIESVFLKVQTLPVLFKFSQRHFR